MEQDYIGKIVKPFESWNMGSLNLTHFGKDWGLSCGSYALTLRFGNCINFLTEDFNDIARKHNLYFDTNFKDFESETYPGEEYCSPPETVMKAWLEAYESVSPEEFFEHEHEYIRYHIYDEAMNYIKDVFNPNNHSRVMQECFWSGSVHMGYQTFCDLFIEVTKDLKNIQYTPAEVLLDLVYDARLAKYPTYERYMRDKGADSERETLRKYCYEKPLPYEFTNASDGRSTGLDLSLLIPEKYRQKETAEVTEVKEAKEITNRVQLGSFTNYDYAVDFKNTIINNANLMVELAGKMNKAYDNPRTEELLKLAKEQYNIVSKAYIQAAEI